MPVTIDPPVKFPLNKPLRVLITIPLDCIHHFAPSVAPFAPDESPESIQKKAGDTVAVIAYEALVRIFDSSRPALEAAMLSLALDPTKSGLRAIKDDKAPQTAKGTTRYDAFELRYDYKTKGVKSPPVLLLDAENGADVKRIKFNSDEPSKELSRELNEAWTRDGAMESLQADFASKNTVN